MPNTRRTFLQSAVLSAGIAGTGSTVAAQVTQSRGTKTEDPGIPGSEIQVPKMKFGKFEVSRLVCGCNPFYGFSHFNNILSTVMREYYTQERVCEVLHQCNFFGINTMAFHDGGRSQQDLRRFQSEGGKMQIIVQAQADPASIANTLKPMAMYHHGELTDRAFLGNKMDTVKEWCRRARDTGVMVGVGTHRPEVIAQVEHEGWDVDFYAGCVYNRTRTATELRKMLNGEALEMEGEAYLQSDPPRMYAVMRQTSKPCFAFKILAAGRIGDRGTDQAFQTAFESIKPIDGVFVGMFPRTKDEIRENAARVRRLLLRS